MNRVPVMVITLCRFEHFCRCIQTLQENYLAEETELYIGLDYPVKEAHWDGYRRISSMLDKGIEGFKEVHIIKHDRNLGPIKNYQTIRDIIYKKFDCYIYTEDDNVFSKNYLEYMNCCMDYFRSNTKVLSVCGYMYPIKLENVESNVIGCSTYFSCYGYGMWRERDALLSANITIEQFRQMYCNRKKMRELRKVSPNQYCNFVKAILGYTGDELIRDGKIRESDLACGLYMFFHGYQMIFPTMTKVRNCGFDGSGENCDIQRNWKVSSKQMIYRKYDFSKQEMDKAEHFRLNSNSFDSQNGQNMLSILLNGFFRIPPKEYVLSVLCYELSLLFGMDKIAHIIEKVRK